MLRTGRRTDWFKIFRPTGCGDGVPVDGAFLVDSLYYFKTRSGKHTEYLPKLLAEIRAETGLVFVAVCSGGAAVYNPGNGGAYFHELLAQVPDGVRYVISVICGNDIYGSHFDESLKLAIADYVGAVDAKVPMHYAVVGMSATTWQYSAWHASAYDIDAQKMRAAFQDECVVTCSGAPELRGLKLSDAIGHVHPDSERVVFNAYKCWLQKCLGAESPPPPPLLPEHADVEAPWIAKWDGAAQAYGFFLHELGFAQ